MTMQEWIDLSEQQEMVELAIFDMQDEVLVALTNRLLDECSARGLVEEIEEDEEEDEY